MLFKVISNNGYNADTNVLAMESPVAIQIANHQPVQDI